MKTLFTILLLGAGALRADYGSRFLAEAQAPLRLEAPGQKVAYRFSSRVEGFVSTVSVYCSAAQDPGQVELGIYADKGGRPEGPALRVGALVPQAGAWNSLGFEGFFLKKGGVYHLVLQQDPKRGGHHPVDPELPGRWAEFAATLPLNGIHPAKVEKDPQAQSLFFDGQAWRDLDRQPVFLLRLGGGSVEGNPYAQALALKVEAGKKAAQVLHFSCGFVPTGLTLRVRKPGAAGPLRFKLQVNDYRAHRLVDFAEGEIPAKAVGSTWSWVTAPLDTQGKALSTECFYVSFETETGAYELGGAQVPAGLQDAALGTFDGGPHYSRASAWSEGAWRDRFEADLNVLLNGESCPPLDPRVEEPATVLPPVAGSAAVGLSRTAEKAQADLAAALSRYGLFHPVTANRQEDLGLLQWGLGRLEAARASLDSALQFQVLAGADADSARLRLWLALLEERQGFREESWNSLRPALDYFERQPMPKGQPAPTGAVPDARHRLQLLRQAQDLARRLKAARKAGAD